VLEAKEHELFFNPSKGNVAFSSAYDCWSFTLPSFLPNVAQKLGMNAKALQKFMWGDFYFANKQISKIPPNDSSKIMFV
jgi:ribosome assembly protein 1